MTSPHTYVQFLGMSTIGGPECEFWQGNAYKTLSSLARGRGKRKPRFQLAISPTRVHIARQEPEPWVSDIILYWLITLILAQSCCWME